MDMKMKDKKKDENDDEVEYTPVGANILIYLSKFFPTVIWSIIQLGIVLVFAGIYMRFPCYDFVVPDEDTSCTGGYQEPTSTLCAAPPAAPLPSARRDPLPPIQEIRDRAVVLDCHDDDGRVGCARRPCARARPRLSARRARLSYGDFYAKSSGARWIAASQMWFAAMMANDIIAEGDDSKLIRKFICDRGLLTTMKKGSEERAEVHRLCGKDDKDATDSTGDTV